MKNRLLTFSALSLSLLSAPLAYSHCQVPCGIYADDNVLADLHKDQETIEKAMKQIMELSKNPSANANQLSRWVSNKEKHAQSIQDIVANYFIAQRIKLGEAKSDRNAYFQKLALLHQISVYAMKCKQTTDIENAQKLHTALNAFQLAYAGKPQAKNQAAPSLKQALDAAHGHTHSHKGKAHKH